MFDEHVDNHRDSSDPSVVGYRELVETKIRESRIDPVTASIEVTRELMKQVNLVMQQKEI